MHKEIVGKIWIGLAHAIDLRALTSRKTFALIEAPNAFQEPLSAQYLMNAGYASGKPMIRIKKTGVRVRNLLRESQQLCALRSSKKDAKSSSPARTAMIGLAINRSESSTGRLSLHFVLRLKLFTWRSIDR
jgi:hypothetical protein